MSYGHADLGDRSNAGYSTTWPGWPYESVAARERASLTYKKCNCQGLYTKVHTQHCAYIKSAIAKDGHVPPNVKVGHVETRKLTSKEIAVSTMKFSTVDTGAKAQRLSVKEVTKVSTAIRVVGIQYARSLGHVSTMKLGTELTLTPEDNPHDENAVVVHCNGRKIGHIERAEAKQVRSVLNSLGESAVKAVVSRVDTSADIYNMLWVVIEATYYIKA